MRVLQTDGFPRAYKKRQDNQKDDLDRAVVDSVRDATIGAALNSTIAVLHCSSVFNATAAMKNITITLDEKTAMWARVHAAQRGISLSRLVGEMLAQRMDEFSEYDHAMRAYLAKPPVKLGRAKSPYPKRDELHDRAGLR
jgi:hypothetical protein